MLYLGFVSVQELLSFQEDINSNKLWAEVRQELGGVLRAALDCKLADNPAQGKKIKATNQGRMRPSASAPASFHNPQPYQLSLPAAAKSLPPLQVASETLAEIAHADVNRWVGTRSERSLP